jgi:hypothetical protein
VDRGVIQRRLDELAVDLGRLRRRIGGGREVWTDLDVWALERLAEHVESLDGMLGTPAAQLAAHARPGCDETVAAAIAEVDMRRAQLRRMLGTVDPLDKVA